MTLSSTCKSSYSHHVSSCVTSADVVSVVVLPVVTVDRGDNPRLHPDTASSTQLSELVRISPEGSSTCVGDPDSDTRVDVDPRGGDDTPVLVLIPFLQRGHGDGEEALLLKILNEDPATGSVPRRFHHDVAQFVLLPSAPVLGVVPVGVSVPAEDGERSSQGC